MFVAAFFLSSKKYPFLSQRNLEIWKHKQANYHLQMWTVRGLICDNVVQMKNLQKVHQDF